MTEDQNLQTQSPWNPVRLIVAGTGDADGGMGDAAGSVTTVNFGPATDTSCPPSGPSNAAAEGPASNVQYEIVFSGGSGPLTIASVTNGGGDVGSGNGSVTIVPTATGPDNNVTQFQAAGNFTVSFPTT